MRGPLGRDHPLVLSPLVDVTDAAFRSVASEWGADVTCSEMVSAAGLVHGNAKSWRLVQPWPGESPYGVQLMGGDADEVAHAVEAVCARVGPDFVDLNLGCPSPNILRSCAGGFLLRDPARAARVVRAAVDAGAEHGTPVSVKMRVGPSWDRPTFLDVGREAEAAGAAWCTLHGRTVDQGYRGEADWSTIAALVDALSVPVVGNGDLRGPDDVLRMRDETGCHGFFIARAAMHDPTVFRRMRQALDGAPVSAPPQLAARVAALRTYLERAGASDAVHPAVLKRQATRFVSGAPGAKAVRQRLQSAGSVPELLVALEGFGAPDAPGSLEVAAADDE